MSQRNHANLLPVHTSNCKCRNPQGKAFCSGRGFPQLPLAASSQSHTSVHVPAPSMMQPRSSCSALTRPAAVGSYSCDVLGNHIYQTSNPWHDGTAVVPCPAPSWQQLCLCPIAGNSPVTTITQHPRNTPGTVGPSWAEIGAQGTVRHSSWQGSYYVFWCTG